MKTGCLFLNIYLPNSRGKSRPVLIFALHGGGFVAGSANEYDGGGSRGPRGRCCCLG